MVASAVQLAKRALLATMRAAAIRFGLTMSCNRDSTEREVVSFFRKLALQAHPDRPGGSTEQQQRLNDARAAWDQARAESKPKGGRPKATAPCDESGTSDGLMMPVIVPAGKNRKEYRLKSTAAMLTYVGFEHGLLQWGRFLGFVADRLKQWKVKHWCATLETTKEADSCASHDGSKQDDIILTGWDDGP